jgi:hypothetical protein
MVHGGVLRLSSVAPVLAEPASEAYRKAGVGAVVLCLSGQLSRRTDETGEVGLIVDGVAEAGDEPSEVLTKLLWRRLSRPCLDRGVPAGDGEGSLMAQGVEDEVGIRLNLRWLTYPMDCVGIVEGGHVASVPVDDKDRGHGCAAALAVDRRSHVAIMPASAGGSRPRRPGWA